MQVGIPLANLMIVNPFVNKDNLVEKYIQIMTVHCHKFWFFGFINYEKSLRNL